MKVYFVVGLTILLRQVHINAATSRKLTVFGALRLLFPSHALLARKGTETLAPH